HSEVHHPDFAGIAEVAALFGKGSEGGWPGLLLPNGLALAGWREPDSQMLPIPGRECFGIMGSEKESTDAGHFLLFRFIFWSRSRRLRGILCRHGESIPRQNEAGSESTGQYSKQLASLKAHSSTSRDFGASESTTGESCACHPEAAESFAVRATAFPSFHC